MSRLRVLDHAVLRIASWPVEDFSGFARPQLRKAAGMARETHAHFKRAQERALADIRDAIKSNKEAATRNLLRRIRKSIISASSLCSEVLNDPRLPPQCRDALAAYDEVQSRLAEASDAFMRQYTDAIEDDRRRLHEVCGTAHFQRALALVNPPVAESWRRRCGNLKAEQARHRRLEHTVVSYLARAVGRPTPHAVWAGVAPVVPAVGKAEEAAASLQFRHASGFVHVEPDLRPFVLAVSCLSARPEYRFNLGLKRNPTLHRRGGQWLFESQSTWRTLSSNPLTDMVLAYFDSDEPQPVQPLVMMLSQDAPEASADIKAALEALCDLDVLRSGLEFPAHAEDSWSALDYVIERLLERDRATWTAAKLRLQSICERMSSRWAELSVDEALKMVGEAGGVIQSVLEEAGAAGGWSGPGLVLTQRLPVVGIWNEAMREAVGRAVAAFLGFHGEDGTAELYRRTSLRAIVEALGEQSAPLLELLPSLRRPGGEPSDDSAEQATPDFVRLTAFDAFADAEVKASALALERRLEWRLAAGRTETHIALPLAASSIPAGLFGSTVIRPAGRDRFWAAWGRPQLGVFATRVAHLLKLEDDSTPVIDCLSKAVRSIEARGTSLRAIVGGDAPNRNAALGPILTERVINVRGHGADGPSALRVAAGAGAADVWLEDGEGGRVLPVLDSAAVLGDSVVAQFLAAVAVGQGWTLTGLGFPVLTVERDDRQELPRVFAGGDVLLSPHRWIVPTEALLRVKSSSETEQYLAWIDELDRRGIPSWARVYLIGQEHLLLPLDSPLCARMLLARLKPSISYLLITEALTGPEECVSLDGRHHVAELAVSWVTEPDL